MAHAVTGAKWSHEELFDAVGGVPFVSPAFAGGRLLYFVAKLRAELAKSTAAELDHFLSPEVAVALYTSIDPKAAHRPQTRAPTAAQAEKIDAALIHVLSVKPEWEPLLAIPVEFRLLLDEQVSSTNPLLPQLIYLGERAFASRVVLHEVLVHELSHVWCGLLCEITDFQRGGGPVDLVLPSGTRGKNTRQVVFASTFAAAAVSYYAAAGGGASTSPHASRMAYCLSYLRRTLVTLEEEGTPNDMGRLIGGALREYARGFP